MCTFIWNYCLFIVSGSKYTTNFKVYSMWPVMLTVSDKQSNILTFPMIIIFSISDLLRGFGEYVSDVAFKIKM